MCGNMYIMKDKDNPRSFVYFVATQPNSLVLYSTEDSPELRTAAEQWFLSEPRMYSCSKPILWNQSLWNNEGGPLLYGSYRFFAEKGNWISASPSIDVIPKRYPSLNLNMLEK